MLLKCLLQAFPCLEEVKSERVKEGTQYRSRVFQATSQLVQGSNGKCTFDFNGSVNAIEAAGLFELWSQSIQLAVH